MVRVDAHHHVWDLAVRPQPWMASSEYLPIARTFDIEEYRQVAMAADVDASIVVQTVSDTTETIELLALAHAEPLIAAVVGWVDLTAPNVADQLAVFASQPGGRHLRGIRHQVHDEADPGWLSRIDVRHGIAAVGAAGLVYELLVRPVHLGAALDIVEALDDVRFVVDHAAKPPIRRHEFEPWNSALRTLAARENTVCKLSGLVTEADWTTWTTRDLRPYVETVIEAFGVDRVMIGSDWPVCTLAASFETSIEIVERVLTNLDPDERAALRCTTASATYDLNDGGNAT